MGTDEVIEDTWIEGHEDKYGWRKLPHQNMNINTTFYYHGGRGGESAAPVVVPAYPAEAPYPSESNEGT